MGIVDFALEHAREGRLVFPGRPNSKQPDVSNPYGLATTDEATIIRWWQESPNRNICLPGGYEIAPGKYLGFIDIDVKNANGLKTIDELDILGFEFPETLAQITPSGGLHFFYYFDFPIRNGVNNLGPGIDTRGFHGYVLGAGSDIDGKGYVFKNQLQVQAAPPWLSGRLGRVQSPIPPGLRIVHDVNQAHSEKRATSFLRSQGAAREGSRNRIAFEAACRLKDFGCTQGRTLDIMSAEWKSEPPLELTELETVVNSAFQYGQNPPGVDAIETAFDPIPVTKPPEKPKHPIDQLNDEYAFLTSGGGCRILWETKGAKGEDRVEHLSLQAFHDKLANRRMTVGDNEKPVPVSKMWMTSRHRREYDGIIFAPNFENKKFFNVWRGFAVGPPSGLPSQAALDSLEYFLEHIRENVCDGDLELTRWVLGFFAHMIQFPQKKPRVALALRGRKGVGKNVITTCLSRILGTHYHLASNRRYLSGNFNSHLENALLLVLDEAYWSGDKAAEGILKDLVTGNTHFIERKGYEPYTVANLTRVMIFGNEDWIVPASEDERRYAVFEVGDGRRGDEEFFGVILDGMRDHGGDQLLFKYLMDFDLSNVSINVAPMTDALTAQKEETLDPFKSWWLGCLKSGLLGAEPWPLEMPCVALIDAFVRAANDQNIRGRLPGANSIGRALRAILPSMGKSRAKREGQLVYAVYDIPLLDQARLEWENFIGGKVKWDVVEK